MYHYHTFSRPPAKKRKIEENNDNENKMTTINLQTG